MFTPHAVFRSVLYVACGACILAGLSALADRTLDDQPPVATAVHPEPTRVADEASSTSFSNSFQPDQPPPVMLETGVGVSGDESHLSANRAETLGVDEGIGISSAVRDEPWTDAGVSLISSALLPFLATLSGVLVALTGFGCVCLFIARRSNLSIRIIAEGETTDGPSPAVSPDGSGGSPDFDGPHLVPFPGVRASDQAEDSINSADDAILKLVVDENIELRRKISSAGEGHPTGRVVDSSAATDVDEAVSAQHGAA